MYERVSRLKRKPLLFGRILGLLQTGFLLAGFINVEAASTEKWPTGDLLGRYQFDESDGDILADVSLNLNHGKLVGAERVKGVGGGAIRFDGRNSYAGIPGNPALDSHDFLSIQFWAKLDKVGLGVQSIAGRSSDWYVRVAKTGAVQFGLHAGEPATSSAVLKPGIWNHVACTYNGKELRVYLNGKLSGTHQEGGRIAFTPMAPVLLGTSSSRIGTDNLRGSLDDLRIYSRPLHPEEIHQLFTDVTQAGKIIAGRATGEPLISLNFSAGDTPGLVSSQLGEAKFRLNQGKWSKDEGGAMLSLSAPTSYFQVTAPSLPKGLEIFTISMWVNLREHKGISSRN